MRGIIKSISDAKSKPAGFRHRGPSRAQDTTLPQEVDDDGSPFFPWLVNATILLQGASSFSFSFFSLFSLLTIVPYRRFDGAPSQL
jgi:hypothetical protein